jgi:probable HAF family extracellular repeat protein
MIDLGTLGGTCGFAAYLNNRGQVVGFSNLAGDQVTDIFFWDRGKLTDLSTPQPAGTLVFANWFDDSGEVVGGMNTPTNFLHAGLWRDGILTDLGSLPGDCYSEAWTSNKGVAGGVSVSCDNTLWRAFLWEDGSIVDLNTLVGPNPALQLIYAEGINDRGEITGTGVLPGVSTAPPYQDTMSHVFVLIPCDDDHQNVEGCDYSMVDVNALATHSSAPSTDIAPPFNRTSPAFGGAANPMLRRFGRRLGPWNRQPVPPAPRKE